MAMVVLYLLIGVLLLLLNAFFVLAEFAAVKMRQTRVTELLREGRPGAAAVQYVQAHLDEFLSVCQVGITLASIGLGFVGEATVAALVRPAVGWTGPAEGPLAHSFAITLAFLLVSFLHILLGELVPKSVAIRACDRTALWIARPLRFFRTLFFVPLVVLNYGANLILAALGLRPASAHEQHSTDEIRIILEQAQSSGTITDRRLLLLENVFDLGEVEVRHLMKPREAARVLRLGAPWEENLQTIRQYPRSRYPLVDEHAGLPLGIVHVKDLLLAGPGADLRRIARPPVATTEDALVEELLPALQTRRSHLAIVLNARGEWTGIITLEDILEGIVGPIEDEFEAEPAVSVARLLTPARILSDLEAGSLEEAIRVALARLPAGELALPADRIAEAVLQRERQMSTYLGRGVALPHARLQGLEVPALVLARSRKGVPIRGQADRVRLVFILLTPAEGPGAQVRLLARLAGLLRSPKVQGDLETAGTPDEVLRVIREAESAGPG